MWLYIGAAIIVAVFLYRFISAKPRAVANAIGRKINVRPALIENMITAMGSRYGRLFVDQMVQLGDAGLNTGAYTFVAFEIMKNDNHQHIHWLKTRLSESGIEPNMDRNDAEAAFMYLLDAGANPSQITKFLEVYNSI